MWAFPEVIFWFLGIHLIIINIPGLILLIFIYLQTVNDKLKHIPYINTRFIFLGLFSSFNMFVLGNRKTLIIPEIRLYF